MLYTRAVYIAGELGSWAVEIYLSKCVQKFSSRGEETALISSTLEERERSYLKKKLDLITIQTPDQLLSPQQFEISPRLEALINILDTQSLLGFTGLVFVQTRAEVAVISHILSVHLQTQKFSVGTFVGTSSYPGRKARLSELADIGGQKTTLDDMREGRKNLVITTNALEEGIDVIACNFIVCFDKPPTLKSFIQRRGRARQPTSKYVLIFEDNKDLFASSGWQELETIMRSIYEDDLRELQTHEDEEECDELLRIESTGYVPTENPLGLPQLIMECL